MGARTVRISITLPEDLLETMERRRHDRHETRSDIIRRAVERLFRKDEAAAEAVAAYVRGYRETPEAADEVAQTHYLGAAALAAEPRE